MKRLFQTTDLQENIKKYPERGSIVKTAIKYLKESTNFMKRKAEKEISLYFDVIIRSKDP